jgi:hypothetical protein
MKEKQEWYVQGDPCKKTFEHKIDAEEHARIQFPHEDVAQRYARIFYREVECDEPMAETIPHADLIRAVLDGKVVQWRAVGKNVGEWIDYDSDVLDVVAALARDLSRNNGDYEFRLKPEPVTKEQALAALAHVHVGFDNFNVGQEVWETLRRFIEEQS